MSVNAKGQTYVSSLIALIVLVAFFLFLLYTGNLVRERIAVQNSADASALAGAVWEARGLNILSALNTGMAIAVAIIVFEVTVLLALSTLCFLTWWIGGGACSLIPNWTYFMRRTIPSLWRSAKEMENIGDKVVKVFPALAIADSLRVSYLNKGTKFAVVYPFIPGGYGSTTGKLTLHVKKGDFGEIVKHVESVVSAVVSKAVSYAVGDVIGGAVGKAVGAVAGFTGRFTGKVLSGLSSSGKVSVEHEEKKTLTRNNCRGVWALVKEVTGMDEWGYSQKMSNGRVVPFMWGVEEDSDSVLTKRRRYELTFTYRHYKYILVDQDRDGNGVISDKDGCVRKWAHFEGHVPGNPFLAKEFSDENWIYMGEMQGDEIVSDYCEALSKERKETCDGMKYTVERWEFRKVEVKTKVEEETSPPDEPPNPFVLMEDAPRELYIATGVKGRRTFAISQARPFSPSAIPGKAFFSMDFDVSLMPPNVLRKIEDMVK